MKVSLLETTDTVVTGCLSVVERLLSVYSVVVYKGMIKAFSGCRYAYINVVHRSI